LALQEAKLFLRIDHDDEDAIIRRMITVAREVAEEIMDSSLLTQSWQITLQYNLPAQFEIRYGPLRTVTSLQKITDDGAVIDLPLGILQPSADGRMVTCSSPQQGAKFVITYDAGLSADAAELPMMLRQNMLQHVAYLYGFRTLDDAQLHDVSKLYSPWRRVKI
jgi:uncharacterized phiE125 gp8 family phage protein